MIRFANSNACLSMSLCHLGQELNQLRTQRKTDRTVRESRRTGTATADRYQVRAMTSQGTPTEVQTLIGEMLATCRRTWMVAAVFSLAINLLMLTVPLYML